MTYDVAIVGAGPAGSASAIHLARAGLRVVVVDRAVFPRDKPCAEYLSPAAEPLLRALGLQHLIDGAPQHRLRGFRIYAPNGSMIQGDFSATRGPDGQSFFETGMVLRRMTLDAALAQTARSEGAEIREGWRLGGVERVSGAYRLRPAGTGAAIEARLLVAADGIHSTVARRLGLHTTGRMRKIGLVAHMRGITGLSEYGEMHVAGRRYVGIAPMEPGDHGALCNVAMVVDEARDGRRLAGKTDEFLQEALRTFPRLRGRLDSLTIERQTLTTSRLSVRASRLVDERLLLVGDATGYYDPFTGEGIFRALRTAQLMAGVATAALARDDLSRKALSAYERLCRQEFRGKRLVEQIIQTAVQHPALLNHIATTLQRRKSMADTMVAVTGDFLAPGAVLRPGYLLRLVM
ncbi:MAG TPA: NAD(P)/FAD-dependent oxidoreductase [Ktedonobacterales bacterium]